MVVTKYDGDDAAMLQRWDDLGRSRWVRVGLADQNNRFGPGRIRDESFEMGGDLDSREESRLGMIGRNAREM